MLYYGLIMIPFAGMGVALASDGLNHIFSNSILAVIVFAVICQGCGMHVVSEQYTSGMPQEKVLDYIDGGSFFCYGMTDRGLYSLAGEYPDTPYFSKNNLKDPEFKKAQIKYVEDTDPKYIIKAVYYKDMTSDKAECAKAIHIGSNTYKYKKQFNSGIDRRGTIYSTLTSGAGYFAYCVYELEP